MSGPGRVSAAVRRSVGRLVPAARRDWVEAVWAEAPEVPPGLGRLGWHAGGAWLVVREAVLRLGPALLLTTAAVAAVRTAWPGSSSSIATPVDRVDVITMAVLAGMPLLARPFLGPVGDSRVARFLRFGTCAALLALMPADTAIDQFRLSPPGGGVDLRLYGLIRQTPPAPTWGKQILVLLVIALYVLAIVGMTSRRSRVAPATLAAGLGAGMALGVVMYAVAPLGLSGSATNPWLAGSDVDPLLLLAWLLLFGGPIAAGVVADRRHIASSSSPPSTRDRVRQILAAGLLTSLTGALFVNFLGTDTIAVMLKASWLRNWLYHGHRLLFGVQNLSSDLKSLSAIAYGHQITGATDAGGLALMIVIFPLIALMLAAWLAWGLCGETAPAGGDSPPGRGGPPGPETPPDGGLPTASDDDADLMTILSGLPQPGLVIDTDGPVPIPAEAALEPAGVP